MNGALTIESEMVHVKFGFRERPFVVHLSLNTAQRLSSFRIAQFGETY